MTGEILQPWTMDVDGCLDYCDNMYLRTNFNTFFIKLSILVLIQLYDWSITIVVSILVFEFVLMFIWFCSCLFFSWRLKFLLAPNTFPHVVQLLFSWQVRCLSNFAWFGYNIGIGMLNFDVNLHSSCKTILLLAIINYCSCLHFGIHLDVNWCESSFWLPKGINTGNYCSLFNFGIYMYFFCGHFHQYVS